MTTKAEGHRDGCMEGRCEHMSDCAVHNEPAMPRGPCDCGHRGALHAKHNRWARRCNRQIRVRNWFVRHEVALMLTAIVVATAVMFFIGWYSGG